MSDAHDFQNVKTNADSIYDEYAGLVREAEDQHSSLPSEEGAYLANRSAEKIERLTAMRDLSEQMSNLEGGREIVLAIAEAYGRA